MALTTAQMLEQAEQALHQLQMGSRTVRLRIANADGSSRDVEYTATTVAQLKAYIAELTALAAGKPVRGALPIRF